MLELTKCLSEKQTGITLIRLLLKKQSGLGSATVQNYRYFTVLITQGSHRLEKYLNIQDSLEKSSKIKFALKST